MKNEEEVFSLERLMSVFDLEKVNSSGAKFDVEKLKWFNHKYLQLKENNSIAEYLIERTAELKNIEPLVVEKAVELTKERANTLTEIWPLCSYLFVRPNEYNEKSLKNKMGIEKIKVVYFD